MRFRVVTTISHTQFFISSAMLSRFILRLSASQGSLPAVAGSRAASISDWNSAVRKQGPKSQAIYDRESKFGAHNYHPLPVALTKGDGKKGLHFDCLCSHVIIVLNLPCDQKSMPCAQVFDNWKWKHDTIKSSRTLHYSPVPTLEVVFRLYFAILS